MNIMMNVYPVIRAHLLQGHSLVRTEISYTATHGFCVMNKPAVCVNCSFTAVFTFPYLLYL